VREGEVRAADRRRPFTIVEAAIAEREGTVRLAVAEDVSVWSSLSPEFIHRNESGGTSYEYVDVPALEFRQVLSDVGIPHYLKVDIEGLDMLCVRTLHHFEERPTFVSIESEVTFNAAPRDRVFAELAELWSLGYRRFKYVNQYFNPKYRLPSPRREGSYVPARFSADSSGPFGEETPGAWSDIGRLLPRAELIRLHHNLAGFGGRWADSRAGRLYQAARLHLMKRPPAWYDLHASLRGT
jgi:hypothetical protein